MSDFYDLLKTDSWFSARQVQEFLDEHENDEPDEIPEEVKAELQAAANFMHAVERATDSPQDAVIVPEASITEYAKYEATELWTPHVEAASNLNSIPEGLTTNFDWSRGPFEYIDWEKYAKEEYARPLPEIVWKDSNLWEGNRTFYVDY